MSSSASCGPFTVCPIVLPNSLVGQSVCCPHTHSLTDEL
jgi:hypothetical protein